MTPRQPVKKKRTVKKKATVKTKGSNAGRIGGEPNKGTEKHSLLTYAREFGKTPAEFMIDIMQGKHKSIGGTKITGSIRMDMAKAVAPYCHPRLRSTEIKGEIVPATLIIEEA